MTINVKIVTTANRSLNFTQSDASAIEEILGSLRMSGQMFSNRTMIIATESETQVISAPSLTRVEIETTSDLKAYVPQVAETPLTLVTPDAVLPAEAVTDTYVSTQIDCFFEGGDTAALWLAGPRPAGTTERLMRLTRLFEQHTLVYKLPRGGVGFMNPARMTRVRVARAADVLPNNAWRLNSAT